MNSWKQYARKLNEVEETYYPAIHKALKKLYSSFTSDLRQHGKDYAINALSKQMIHEPVLKVLNSIYKNVGLWGAKLTNGELSGRVKQAEKKAFGFGRNQQWINEVLRYLALYGLQFAQSISDTTKEDILKILQRGVDENLSIDAIVQELQTTGILATRARTIARTEIFRAANVGHAIAAQSFPFEVNKKWLAARDHRTRHSHRQVHTHVVDETGTFTVPIYKDKEGKQLIGYDNMLFPCDPKASARNTINCRCRIIHEPKRDANGALLRRETIMSIS